MSSLPRVITLAALILGANAAPPAATPVPPTLLVRDGIKVLGWLVPRGQA